MFIVTLLQQVTYSDLGDQDFVAREKAPIKSDRILDLLSELKTQGDFDGLLNYTDSAEPILVQSESGTPAPNTVRATAFVLLSELLP